jgi:hypothetical protein
MKEYEWRTRDDCTRHCQESMNASAFEPISQHIYGRAWSSSPVWFEVGQVRSAQQITRQYWHYWHVREQVEGMN